MTDSDKFIQYGREAIHAELEAVENLALQVNAGFAKACAICLNTIGRIVVCGMGKSGHIANKIAATLASTGSPAFFLHPAEAAHGDVGMITSKDTVLAISNSGETKEILAILPLMKRIGAQLICITNQSESNLAQAADAVINIAVKSEACPHNLAPTSSTTASLIIGDALAIALLRARGFSANDFYQFHPSGSLGRRFLRVKNVMRSGELIPRVTPDTFIADALTEMTQKSLGMTCVSSDEQKLLGIYTDGDLRRSLSQGHNIDHTKVSAVMTKTFKKIHPEALADQAIALMENLKITALVVVDDSEKLVGIVHMHDLLNAGIS